MQSLPVEWPALCGIVFLLGLQHGIDADHLAAIDGLTRLNARRGRWFARWCGVLFAMGHGLVVIAVAISANLASHRWSLPPLLETTGSLVSICLLTLIGIINLAAALRRPGGVCTPPGKHDLPALWHRRWASAERPVTVALVGSLLAVSFDTMSQAAVLALAATQFGGAGHAACLAGFFSAGMLLADGICGFWVSHLVGRADRMAIISSRVMSLALAALSLLVAAVGAARMVLPPPINAPTNLAFGVLVIVLTGSGYLVALWVARRERARPDEANRPSGRRADTPA